MNAYEQTRQALVAVQKKIEYLCGSFNVPNSLVAGRMEINGIINAALAIPRRNCDVGTAEEQKFRMVDFCKDRKCVDCVFRDTLDCRFDWEQMPYSEEGIEN